jgi:hypothetical protein
MKYKCTCLNGGGKWSTMQEKITYVLQVTDKSARGTTLCGKVCQWLATGWWFSLGPLVSYTNKTDITKILLKEALSFTSQKNKSNIPYVNELLTYVNELLTYVNELITYAN